MRRLVVLAAMVLGAPTASSAALDYTGVRSLGMGQGLRGFATGDAGLMLNPSGMSLLRAYTVEADYQLRAKNRAHVGHASIVDSTSGYNIGGGIYYTFAAARPDGGPERSDHEAGLALSFPFGDRFFLGGTLKYLHLDDAADSRGLTVDAGITVRPLPAFTMGVAVYNLRDLDIPETQRGVGYGIAAIPAADVLVVIDGVTHFAAPATGNKTRTSVMGGAEALLAKRLGVRAGGGWDAWRENGYMTAGLSAVSGDGAIDVSFRQDVTGSTNKETLVAVGLRLFVSVQ